MGVRFVRMGGIPLLPHIRGVIVSPRFASCSVQRLASEFAVHVEGRARGTHACDVGTHIIVQHTSGRWFCVVAIDRSSLAAEGDSSLAANLGITVEKDGTFSVKVLLRLVRYAPAR